MQRSEVMLKIQTEALQPDKSITEQDLSRVAWERISDQRDVMINAMRDLFLWLNGGVYALVVAAWIVGIWNADYRIVDAKTLMTLIGATVVQAGIAFIAITRFLFPAPKGNETTGLIT